MNPRQAFSGFFWWGLLGGIALGGGGTVALLAYMPAKAAAPAAVKEKPKSEADLTRTTLSDKHYQSLHIAVEPARSVPVQQRLLLHGWIIAPPGRASVIAAPAAGYVRLAGNEHVFPAPLQVVKQGQLLCQLEPVPTPVEQAQLQATLVQMQALRRGIEGELTKARDTATLAKQEQKRTEGLVANKLRSEQDLEQANTRLKYAETDLAAAEDKLRLFDASFGNIEKGLIRPQILTAPQDGMVLAVQVSPGQFVPAGTVLATVVDLSQPWLRVPVAEQDLQRVDPRQEIDLQLAPDGPRWKAEPVGLVPLVDPAQRTADLLYRIIPTAPNEKAPPVFAKDLLVTVFVPVSQEQKETVVPAAALVHDAFGGTWLYLEISATKDVHLFERRRVELGPVVEQGQVIRPRLSEKDRVVVKGAESLFSREFHKPPANAPIAPTAPVKDDD